MSGNMTGILKLDGLPKKKSDFGAQGAKKAKFSIFERFWPY